MNRVIDTLSLVGAVVLVEWITWLHLVYLLDGQLTRTHPWYYIVGILFMIALIVLIPLWTIEWYKKQQIKK